MSKTNINLRYIFEWNTSLNGFEIFSSYSFVISLRISYRTSVRIRNEMAFSETMSTQRHPLPSDVNILKLRLMSKDINTSGQQRFTKCLSLQRNVIQDFRVTVSEGHYTEMCFTSFVNSNENKFWPLTFQKRSH